MQGRTYYAVVFVSKEFLDEELLVFCNFVTLLNKDLKLVFLENISINFSSVCCI